MNNTTDLNITIVGPGAVGCLLAHGLQTAGYRVNLLDYREERAERIRKNGITVLEEGSESVSKPFCTADASHLPVQDVVIFTVKAYQTGSAAMASYPLVGEGTVVLSLQNGMGYEHFLKGLSLHHVIATGTTALGATLVGEARVKVAGKGPTEMGFSGVASEPQKQVLYQLEAAFNKAGYECRVVADPEMSRWNKLMANVGINAITAVSCIRNGEILVYDDAACLQEAVVREAFAVMNQRLRPCSMEFDDVIQMVREITKRTAENCSSMLQDRMKSSVTEIDYINGFIYRAGKEAGIATPVNETLWRIIRLLSESGWRSVHNGC